MRRFSGLAGQTASVFGSRTAQDDVAARLRDALIQGEHQPGEALKIRDLAQLYGTSMQPVRAAIRELVAEKALESLPNRSARVPLLTRDRLDDLTRVRLAVEGLAVSLAAKNVTDADLRALEAILDDDEPTQRMKRHRDFHFRIYDLAGSSALGPIIESLWLQLGPYLRQATDTPTGQGQSGSTFHRALLAALARHDGRAAVRALELDIRRSATLFRPAGEGPPTNRLAS